MLLLTKLQNLVYIIKLLIIEIMTIDLLNFDSPNCLILSFNFLVAEIPNKSISSCFSV